MEKSYTLKEAADLLGLTKTGVMYHLRMMGGSINKDAKGRIIVTEDALSQIRETVESAKYKVQSANFAQSESDNFAQSESDNFAQSESDNFAQTLRQQNVAEMLQIQIFTKDREIAKLHEEIAKLNELLTAKDDQIAEKDRQIERKDEQLGSLTEALTAAQRTAEGSQALHAATVKQLQAAQSVVPPTIQEEPRNLEEEKEKPEERRWFIPDDDEEDPPLQKRKKRSLLNWLLGRD